MVLLIPVNGVIAAKSRSFQMQQMKKKDERVKMMNEILQGIKILKLNAWENSFQDMVSKIRSEEINILKKMGYLQAGSSFIWSCAPFLVSLVSFGTFVLVDPNNVLDSEKAFVSLSLFNILRFPLSMLPMMISLMVQSSVSVKRLNKFMNAEEVNSDIKHEKSSPDQEFAVEAKDASFAWTVDQKKPTLSDISINVKRGSLVAVVGTVGAGKSSLISAILGELKKTSGSMTVRGEIAFVAQQAWIQNATLRDNILFGNAFNKDRYEKIIEACALKPDLAILPGGDETEIGEKGINLSGGQKLRVSLARAIYSPSSLYLLDDPLSAVDSHVGKHIFESVIGSEGLLKDTTRILVTHGMTFLPKVDLIVVLKDGVVSESGTYVELLERKGAFAEILVQYLSEDLAKGNEEEANDLKTTLEQALGAEEVKKTLRQISTVSESKKSGRSGSIHSNASEEGLQSRKNSSARKKSVVSEKEPEIKPPEKKQYQEEKAETGKVNMRVYLYYLVNMGVWLFLACFLCFSGYQVCSAYSSIWLSMWSDDADNSNSTSHRDMYLGVYGALGVGQAIFAVIGSVCLYLATLEGAKTLHNVVLSNILRSPMNFFDTTPQGRILNRFSKDVDVLDSTMPMILRGWITCLLAVVSTFLIITYATPLFLVPILVILCAYYFVQKVYVASSRQLKRLESISRSPIYSHFGETISGAQTIRAYKLEEQFIADSERKVDYNQRAVFPSNVANRWLAVRLETVGNIVIFCSAVFAVLEKDNISPGLVGLSVSYALSVTQTLNWLVRMTSEVETNIVAVERLKEYAETKQEAAWDLDANKEKPFNPTKGKIEFRNYSTRYREGLGLVLDKVSFTVEGGERVGIVGRTGAGKSSLTLALFRLIEPVEGQILIDGVDIFSLGLHELRSKLAIIPQEPVLFSGTIRSNLDPFGLHGDDAIVRALQLAHLGDFLASQEEGLSFKLIEGGTNMSVGQRQLMCLARALLAKANVLVLDEATAAVDMETDDIIQATIRQEFKDTTILTIAHRINTIMDYSKVVVLTNGTVAEEDTPAKLMADEKSLFHGMCVEAGIA